MKAYILSIAGVILLSSVVTIICPTGKMGKFVKGTMRLFILVVMLSPLVGWIRVRSPDLTASVSYEIDENYLSRCAAILEEQDESEICAFLLDEFSISAEIDVIRAHASFFPREKITVVLSNAGIIAEDERIYIMTCIQEVLEARYDGKVVVR